MSCDVDMIHSKTHDIEDLAPDDIVTTDTEASDKSTKIKNNKEQSNNKNRELSDLSNLDGGIPGIHTIYIKTWGCSHNWSDSEYMAGILIKDGYHVTFKEEESLNSNIWILNSCTVKGRAQNLFETALKKGKQLNKYIIAAGCVPSGDKQNKLWKDISLIGVQQIDSINYCVKETLKGNCVKLLKNKNISINSKRKRKAGGAPLSMPKLRRNKYEEIIPINTGCLNQCTYCKTKHARGDLGSYSIDEIINRIRQVIVNDNIRIINLESEDTGAYGIDIGTNIAELLKQIEIKILNNSKLNRNIMLRLGISNPPYFLEHSKKVAKILLNKKVFKYIHIPVQSGANKVLYDMKRKYTIQEFEELCNIMSDELNGDLHICTDIIAGFPTEKDTHWKKTMDLIKNWKFTTMYMSPFFPRPGTPAASMDYVYGNNYHVDVNRIKKERIKEITKLFNTFEPFKKRLNTKQFWICNKGLTKDDIHYVGLNMYYEKILVKSPFDDCDLSGKILEVDVFECGKKYMYGSASKEYIKLLQEYPNEINYIELYKELNKRTFMNIYYVLMTLVLAIIIWYYMNT